MSTKTTLWPPFQRRAAPPPHPPVIFTGRALQGAAPLTVERKMVVLETTPLDKDELGRRRGERGTSPTNTHTGARERGPQCPRASTPIRRPGAVPRARTGSRPGGSPRQFVLAL